MAFEAYYSKMRLAFLALLGLGFAALGIWMAGLPASEFEDGSGRRLAGLAGLFGVETATMGHIIGWLCLAMGLLVLPVVVGNLRHKGPAMRVDQHGIFWHRWSDTPIPWDNIAAIAPYRIQRQAMVGLTLHDSARSPARGWMGKVGSANKAMGFGDLTITLQGTDGKYDDLLDALARFGGDNPTGTAAR